MKKIKQTQGNRKLKQYLEDLSENKSFLSLYKQITYKSDKKRQKELLEYAAEQYGVDFDLFQTVTRKIEEDELIWGDRPDVCEIADDYDDVFNPEFHYFSPKQSQVKQLHIRSHPLSINIHKLASKRDVLDFIEKRWDIIENYLESYRKKTRIRTRENKKINNFIWNAWEHSHTMNIREIKNALDKQFPDNKLVYFEIYKIISLEKRRRYKNAEIGT